MQIKIHLPQPTTALGVQTPVDVELVNTGAEPATLPVLNDPNAKQPFFTLTGPGLEQPQTFYWRGALPRGSNPPHETATLAPGATLHGKLDLPATLPAKQEGEYSLYATYEWNGLTAESNHVKLTLTAPALTVLRVAGITPVKSVLGIQSLAVSGLVAYLASFSEVRPEIGETSFDGLSPIFDLEPGALDFFAPWRQTAEPGPVTARFGWRVGNRVSVAGFRKRTQTVEAPFADPRVHAPSLMNAHGDIDVFVTENGGRRLALLRFPQTVYNAPPPPASVVWTHELPEPVTAVTGSLNPSGAHAAVVRMAASAALLQWTDAGPSLGPTLRLTGRPVLEVAPAFHISAAGLMRASILTNTGAADNGPVTITEIQWPAAGDDMPRMTRSMPIDLPAPIRSGSIAYSMAAIESPRREWFFLLANGRVQSSRMEGKSRPTKLVIPEPPQLAIMSAAAYCLVVQDGRPKLTMLQ